MDVDEYVDYLKRKSNIISRVLANPLMGQEHIESNIGEKILSGFEGCYKQLPKKLMTKMFKKENKLV
jgi:hypothetical protein